MESAGNQSSTAVLNARRTRVLSRLNQMVRSGLDLGHSAGVTTLMCSSCFIPEAGITAGSRRSLGAADRFRFVPRLSG